MTNELNDKCPVISTDELTISQPLPVLMQSLLNPMIRKQIRTIINISEDEKYKKTMRNVLKTLSEQSDDLAKHLEVLNAALKKCLIGILEPMVAITELLKPYGFNTPDASLLGII